MAAATSPSHPRESMQKSCTCESRHHTRGILGRLISQNRTCSHFITRIPEHPPEIPGVVHPGLKYLCLQKCLAGTLHSPASRCCRSAQNYVLTACMFELLSLREASADRQQLSSAAALSKPLRLGMWWGKEIYKQPVRDRSTATSEQKRSQAPNHRWRGNDRLDCRTLFCSCSIRGIRVGGGRWGAFIELASVKWRRKHSLQRSAKLLQPGFEP